MSADPRKAHESRRLLAGAEVPDCRCIRKKVMPRDRTVPGHHLTVSTYAAAAAGEATWALPASAIVAATASGCETDVAGVDVVRR